MKEKLQRFIRDDRTFIGILFLILLSISVTVIDTIGTESSPAFDIISHILTTIFVIELLIRWYISDSFISFLKDCWLEIIAVFPVARSFRLIRLLRLISWGVRARRQHRLQSFGTVLSENIAIIVVPIVIIIGAAMAILRFESNQQAFTSPGKSLMWSLSTLMAGEPIYGEPLTIGGKIVTALLMFAGFTFFAFFTGVVSTYMTRRLRDEVVVDTRLLASLKDHFIICGWNQAGPNIIKELRSSNETRKQDIVIVAEEKPYFDFNRRLNNGDIFFVKGDYTTGQLLDKVSVSKARSAIFLASRDRTRSSRDNDARTVLAALTAEKMQESNNDIYSCVELLDRNVDKMDILQAAKVEDVLEGNEFMGHLIAHSISLDGLNYILDNVLTSSWGAEFKIRHCHHPKSFGELVTDYKNNNDCILIGYGIISENGGRAFTVNPSPEYMIEEKTPLLLISPSSKLGKSNAKWHTRISTATDTQTNSDGHIIICGWSRAVPHIVEELCTKSETSNNMVLLIAELRKVPPQLAQFEKEGKLKLLPGDFASNSILKTADIPNANAAIIVADTLSSTRPDSDRDARSVLTALTIEKHNPSIRTSVELLNYEEHKVSILRKANVEFVVSCDKYLGNMIAQSTRSPGLAIAINELLTSNYGSEFICTTYSSEAAQFSDILAHYYTAKNQIVVGMRRKTESENYQYMVNPGKDELVIPGDELYMISSTT